VTLPSTPQRERGKLAQSVTCSRAPLHPWRPRRAIGTVCSTSAHPFARSNVTRHTTRGSVWCARHVAQSWTEGGAENQFPFLQEVARGTAVCGWVYEVRSTSSYSTPGRVSCFIRTASNMCLRGACIPKQGLFYAMTNTNEKAVRRYPPNPTNNDLLSRTLHHYNDSFELVPALPAP
jgi:hypothetical protein